MIRASARALTEKNGRGPTTTEIHEDIALKDRPPKKEHIPAMLNAVGSIERERMGEKEKEDANGALHPDHEASNSIDVVAKEVERLNADEKPIATANRGKKGIRISVAFGR